MRALDLIALILENLGRRKARVALTAVGVIIGTAAVVVLVSLGIGLQQSATQQLYGIPDLTQIDVYPKYDFGPGPVVVESGGGGNPGSVPTPVPMTDKTIESIRAIPGVELVAARDYLQTQAVLRSGRLEAYAGITGISVDDLERIGVEARSGALTLERGQIIIGAQVADAGFWDPRGQPGVPPAAPDLLGARLSLVVSKWAQDGTEIKKTIPVQVVGITRQTGQESDWSVYMRLEEVTALNQWAFGRRINRDKEGYPQLLVRVTDVDTVLDIAEQINALGYQANTSQQYLEPINNFYLILQIIFGGVGAIALLVAAIGIANTMAMAILERTREIGLMKAIGATNNDVLSVFLGEAAGIGFVGGLGGVLAGWGAGPILNVLATAYFAGQAAQAGGPPPAGDAVVTPLWLPIASLVFATLIGLISGLYPALRAATLVPVAALKYE